MARYSDAVDWIAFNDADGDDEDVEALSGYLTVALVADVFGKSADDVAEAVYRRRHPKARRRRRGGRMTAGQLVANHRRMTDPPPCVHGHFGCSCTAQEGGPCLDETLASMGID